MVRPFALFLCVPLVGCGPDLDGFRRICERDGQVQVHDPAGRSHFVQTVRNEHAEHGGWLNDAGTHYAIAPVPGFGWESEYTRGKELPGSSETRNDIFIRREGRPVATLVNYTIRWQTCGSGQQLDCVGAYPEIYGVEVMGNSA